MTKGLVTDGGMAKTVCEREIGFRAATTQKMSFCPPQ